MAGLRSIRSEIKCLTIIVSLFFIMLTISPAGAEDNKITYGSACKFGAGIISAYMIHEAGHFLVAGATGTHLHWEVGSYNQPLGYTESADSDDKGVAVNSAGLIFQLIGSEVILYSDKIDKNDAFVRGMMAWNIINPILYSLDYWFIRRTNQQQSNKYRGDIEGVEYYSNKRTANIFAFSVAALASFQGYRYLKTQDWAPEWIKGETHTVNFAPMPSGGFALMYEYRF
ncbi:MAG: hypothetical protein KJN62_00045 [Deltaproteobacteria bacterium]|nr:hypothetical protein [Deltaproteobacteria bacterium]